MGKHTALQEDVQHCEHLRHGETNRFIVTNAFSPNASHALGIASGMHCDHGVVSFVPGILAQPFMYSILQRLGDTFWRGTGEKAHNVLVQSA